MSGRGSIWDTTSASEPFTEETFRKSMEALRQMKPRQILHGSTPSALRRAYETGNPYFCLGCGGFHRLSGEPGPTQEADQ